MASIYENLQNNRQYTASTGLNKACLNLKYQHIFSFFSILHMLDIVHRIAVIL